MSAKARFQPVVRRFVSRVMKVTRGNPRYINQVLKMLNARGVTSQTVLYVKQVIKRQPGAAPKIRALNGHNREHRTSAVETPSTAGSSGASDAEPPEPDEYSEPHVSISAPDPAFVGGAREVCRVHGWIGKLKFYSDKHDTCEIGLPPIFDDIFDDAKDDDEDLDDMPEPVQADDEYFTEGNKRRRKSPRQLGVPRKRTVPTKQLTRAFLKDAAIKLEIEEKFQPINGIERPKTRADCVDGPRPCPWVACRHHLYLEINPITGSITFNRPDIEPWEMDHSCSLDIADEGDHTLEQVGFLTNITRERVRQLEVPALTKLRSGLAAKGVKSSGDGE